MNIPEKTGNLLDRYLKKYGLHREFKRRQVIMDWNKITEGKFFHLTPLFFEKDVLICKVDDFSYLNELNNKKEELKEKINRYLNKYKIEDIRIIK